MQKRKREILKDKIYYLGFKGTEAIRATPEYMTLKRIISNAPLTYKNEVTGVIAKIFIPEIAYILTSKKVQYTDSNLEVKYLDGTAFLKQYIHAYSEGEQAFEKEFGITKDTLYGTNGERYVADLHYQYFHADIKGTVTSSFGRGWHHWRETFSMVISKDLISECGYYSGFIGKVLELRNKHPEAFRNFDKCELKEHEQAETKTDKLKAVLGKYGFFELPKVKPLSEPNKVKLVELLNEKGLPYSIAMFDFLGYLKHLQDNHFPIKKILFKEVAKWFNSDKEGRAVKGNISSLLKNTTENKDRYTAHLHKETVQKDYQALK